MQLRPDMQFFAPKLLGRVLNVAMILSSAIRVHQTGSGRKRLLDLVALSTEKLLWNHASWPQTTLTMYVCW
jgi:hypothetical protein